MRRGYEQQQVGQNTPPPLLKANSPCAGLQRARPRRLTSKFRCEVSYFHLFSFLCISAKHHSELEQRHHLVLHLIKRVHSQDLDGTNYFRTLQALARHKPRASHIFMYGSSTGVLFVCFRLRASAQGCFKARPALMEMAHSSDDTHVLLYQRGLEAETNHKT